MAEPHPLEHYEAVTEVYLEVMDRPYGERGRKHGNGPGQEIALRWDVPVSTAHRWIRRCRALGLLYSTAQGSGLVRCTHACPHCCRP